MDSINPAKKREAEPDPPSPPGQNVVAAKIRENNEEMLRRCESLERSVQVLKKEVNWAYPDIPMGHWVDQSNDGDSCNRAYNAVRSMKKRTQNLRSGRSYVVTFGGTSQFPILRNRALGPHWEQLSNAIQLSPHIQTLHFSYVELDEPTLDKMEASARQRGITRFGLTDNSFRGGEGVQFAIKVLKSNRSVTDFCWEDNSFNSAEDACTLVDAILEHPTICRLEIKGSLNEDIVPLRRLLGGVGTGTLLDINLSNSQIKTNGDRCISDFLSTNPPLERLNLERNQLTDDDALHIALALQLNSNLKRLDMQVNELTKEGKSAMYSQSIYALGRSDLSALKSVGEENLNTVSGANHSCEIVGVSSGDDFMNCSNKSAKWNRGRKLSEVLVKRYLEGCNISQLESEFSEDGMGLVPHVLACIHTYSAAAAAGQEYCPSIPFEVVRNWKTPEMYQFLKKDGSNSEIVKDLDVVGDERPEDSVLEKSTAYETPSEKKPTKGQSCRKQEEMGLRVRAVPSLSCLLFYLIHALWYYYTVRASYFKARLLSANQSLTHPMWAPRSGRPPSPL